MPPQIMKAEALHEIAILAVRLAIAFDEDPCPGSRLGECSLRPAWMPSADAELDTWENVIIVASVDRLLAPLGENVKRELRDFYSTARQ